MTDETKPPVDRETKPKPCPMCGSKVIIETERVSGEGILHWCVCSNRECNIGIRYGEYTIEESIERWNTRAGSPDREKIREVLRVLENANNVSTSQFYGKIQGMIEILREVAGEKEKGK